MSSRPCVEEATVPLQSKGYSAIPVTNAQPPNRILMNDAPHTSHHRNVPLRTAIATSVFLAVCCGLVGRASINWADKGFVKPNYAELTHAAVYHQGSAMMPPQVPMRTVTTGAMGISQLSRSRGISNAKASEATSKILDDSWLVVVEVSGKHDVYVGKPVTQKCPAEKPNAIGCWCNVLPYPACTLPNEGEIVDGACRCSYRAADGPCVLIVQYAFLTVRCV